MKRKCPTCKRAVEESEPYFPFCSERCKLIDLGNWASEKYVISTPLRKDPSAAEHPAEREPDDDAG
ncbi:MAG TPA: DNA gyrase inhibitor YacG [Bryobacterales bacterium]|nr:DNA gyrase inhibitor YacG [Bryobacterales bacterium]